MWQCVRLLLKRRKKVYHIGKLRVSRGDGIYIMYIQNKITNKNGEKIYKI